MRTKTTCVSLNMGPKEIKIVADAIGSLAERVALDCDHHNMNHKEWYRAVRRARKLLSVTLTNQPMTNQPAPALSQIVSDLEKTTQCNCDLDNWEPERDTGHSCVCRIHKLAKAAKLNQRDEP